MGTGLEADIGGAAACPIAGLSQGLGFRVRPAALARLAAPDDPAAGIEEDAAHRRVGPGSAERTPGETQRRRHMAAISPGLR
jgi:hypothetical protein